MVQVKAISGHEAMLLIDCGNGGDFYIGGLPRNASTGFGAPASNRRPPFLGWRPEP
jgi:hypothetical protein